MALKLTFIALLALCLCLPLAGADKETHVERDGYKGRVKSVKISQFKIEEKFGKAVRVPYEGEQGWGHDKDRSIKYDEKGNEVEIVWYDASGKIDSKRIFKYDEKENVVEEARYEQKTAFGKTRYVPTKEYTYEFTYWD